MRLGCKLFLIRFLEPFKSLLNPSWDHFLDDFGRVLGVENDANKDLNMSNLCFRFSENQKMKVRRPPKNHQKSMKKRLRKHVNKKSPKLSHFGPIRAPPWAPRNDSETGVAPLGAQLFSFSCFCCFLLPSWGILGPSCCFYPRPGGLRAALSIFCKNWAFC